MSDIILAPKYYLDHFEKFVQHILKHHYHLLDESHIRFVEDYQKLSEDAKCVLIRMINRTGPIFDKQTFIYSEINNIEASWDELTKFSFIRSLMSLDIDKYLAWLKKEDLQNKLAIANVIFDKNFSKKSLLSLAIKNKDRLENLINETDHMVVFDRSEELLYILYLYFGRTQDKLILHTLRDLGIRKSNPQANFKSKFRNKNEALNHYFYCLLNQKQKNEFETFSLSDIELWPSAILDETKIIREDLLLNLAKAYQNQEDLLSSLEFLKKCEFYPASERRVRLYFQLGAKESCLAELDRMIESPFNDEEILFAEDFLQRKFHKKRVSSLTETLRSAEKIFVDEAFYRQPELGVISHFKELGVSGHFSENHLWNTLFWTVLHEELQSETHNEFDHASPDLREKKFYTRNQSLIENKFLRLNEKSTLKDLITQKGDTHKEMILDFIDHVPLSLIFQVLRYMAQDYYGRSSGYPDIFIIKEDNVIFYEIKAEGDSLNNSQIKQMKVLESFGFEVRVLQVAYQFNPNQTYVVVDLETTGPLTSYNRITEIGAVKLKGNKIIDRFQTLINPTRTIPKNIQQLTGISNEMVKEAPKFEDIAEKFLDFTKDAIFVAHNVQFDYGFLKSEFHRINQNFVRPFICTKVGMRKHYPDLHSYGLKNLCDFFKIELQHHHRAMSDAEAAANLLILINEKRQISQAALDNQSLND